MRVASRLASRLAGRVIDVPEESLEAPDIKEKLDEAIGQSRKPRWIACLSLATAFMAVFAALASPEAGAHSNDANYEKNEAVLHQSQASDKRSSLQAKGSEATSLKAKSQPLPPMSSALAKRFTELAEHRAKELEKTVAESNQRATTHSDRHSLTRRSLLFWGGLAGGLIGAILFALGLA